eukprot:m.23695 g.23695  ORF g.23695 m.23695 type:complete len:108 (+) comp5987_c0_seq1:1-324(+)
MNGVNGTFSRPILKKTHSEIAKSSQYGLVFQFSKTKRDGTAGSEREQFRFACTKLKRLGEFLIRTKNALLVTGSSQHSRGTCDRNHSPRGEAQEARARPLRQRRFFE